MIDASNRASLKGSLHPLATHAADRGIAPDSLELGRTILLLQRSAAQQKALDQLAQDQQNPQSPRYHKWITPEQFGVQYGVATQDIDAVDKWLQSFGLQVEPTMPGHNIVAFTGTHAQLKAAFNTELHRYDVNGTQYYANATRPSIPAALAPVIAGFASLNNFPKPGQHTKTQSLHHAGGAWSPQAGTHAAFSRYQPNDTTSLGGQNFYALAPYDLATIYNLRPLWDAGIDGTGQSIAIIGDADIDTADVDYFRKAFGLPATKLNVIHYGPDPGGGDGSGVEEASLDVEWAGAVAKNATIDLVISPNTATSAGIDSAAIYVIENNLTSILNASFGECEIGLGTAGNEFYSEIWEQAAAQGITVTVAAGDSGSATCDQGSSAAFNGLTVSGIASTPYNVAVGGTDLYGTYLDPSRYWTTSNDPTTLQSARSYVPELPWNNSCGSPQVLAYMQSLGATDTTTEALCNDYNVQGVLTTAGGSGGVSSCASADPNTGQCLGGYAKPAWQSQLQGVPADGARDLPDISLMSGSGSWGSLYLFCASLGGGSCDVNSNISGAGGTSFASPIFAGLMALVQQKTSSAQGNPNYILYKLAQTQLAGGNASACATSNLLTGNSCVFYDITAGTNAVPCFSGTLDCTLSNSADLYGVLPGYAANAGYDLATGIGSINFTNMVNAWQSAASSFTASSTALTSTNTTINYGSPLSLNVAVGAVSPATGTPTGDISVVSNSSVLNSNAIAGETLVNGASSITATLLPGGTYQLSAHYTGDMTFAPSESAPLTVHIMPYPITNLALDASTASIVPNQNVTLSITVPGLSGGVTPTGTVTFTNATSNAVLGTATLSSVAGATNATGYLTVSSSQLQPGANSLTATFSGDLDYSRVTTAATTVVLGNPFAASINPSALTLSANTAGTATVTLTPLGSLALNPANISLKCPATLPAGLNCVFSTPVAGANGTVLSTLSLQTASPLITIHPLSAKAVPTHNANWLLHGSVLSMAGLMLFGVRRRRLSLSVATAILLSSAAFLVGCSNNSNSQNSPTAPLSATVTTLSASSATAALKSPITFTASVAPASGSGSPSGAVTFTSASGTVGTAAVNAGTASLTLSSLPAGTQSLTATYSGDAVFASSTSAARAVDITFATTLTITASDTYGDTTTANLDLNVN
ncbi:Ig-like domain repeat protein [Granulicella cerasi]|uniref:Ig-like domain repeat protein n=1 Tax=Granulicella cerasi TaxID=741063 RepID=A0ABW1ZBF7_9BACT|nr:Ig-like domain repeat protein [Granulicella cerasi]